MDLIFIALGIAAGFIAGVMFACRQIKRGAKPKVGAILSGRGGGSGEEE